MLDVLKVNHVARYDNDFSSLDRWSIRGDYSSIKGDVSI